MKPTDHTIRPKKQPKVYLKFRGYRRGVFTDIPVTKADSRRDAVYSKMHRIMRAELDHVKFRKYTIKAEIV